MKYITYAPKTRIVENASYFIAARVTLTGYDMIRHGTLKGSVNDINIISSYIYLLHYHLSNGNKYNTNIKETKKERKLISIINHATKARATAYTIVMQ